MIKRLSRPISPTPSRIHSGVLAVVGNTPLVRLKRYLQRDHIDLIVKLESFNPGGSAKDRPALQMLKNAIESGRIGAATTVIESSSGNMGIGLAHVCRYYGLNFICVVDPHTQAQNIDIMRALGARIEMVQQPRDSSYLAARWNRVSELMSEVPHAFWPNQYANPQNPLAHEQGTIREIDEALGGEFDFLFVATSSTGTASGCRDYLHSRGRSTQVIAVDAVGSILFGGAAGERIIPGLGAGRIPELAKGQGFDEVHRVRDLDCVVGCRRLAEREAILVGGSSGGVLETIRSMSNRISGSRCVAILHDSGTRYLDTVFSDDWVERKIGVSPGQLRRLVDSNLPLDERLAESHGCRAK